MNIKLSLLFLLTMFLLSCNHSTDPSSGENEFGIYLLKDLSLTTVDVKEMPIEKLKVQEETIINLEDIVEYDWEKQIISLTPNANEKFKEFDKKQISASGLPFIVMTGKEKIYLGNIYPMYSSYYDQDVPTIKVVPFTELKISKALSESSEDKRMDKRVYNVLKKYKKIK